MSTLMKEIIIAILEKEEMQIIFPNLKFSVAELVELKCYSTLQKIKIIIEDDSLSDKECLTQIEEIISVFEKIGSNGKNRHDFG